VPNARRLTILLTLALAAAIPGSVDGRTNDSRGAAPATIAMWRFCTNCVDTGGDLSRYRYVGLNAWQHDRIASLKAANPELEALVYKDMASTRGDSCAGLDAAGVDYCWANDNRPEWFTVDAAGARIEWAGYPGTWQMDVGNPAYQQQWAANVVDELRANGWDGVVVDNANVDQSGYLAGRTMAEYPSQRSYEDATRSFVANVCPAVIRAGFLCLPNIQAHPVLADAKLWADWLRFTSGGVREYWVKWGGDTGGHYADGGWDDLHRVARAAQADGKIFVPVTYAPSSDVRSMRWARANFLLSWSGGPSALVFSPTPEQQDPWSNDWTVDVGRPLGPAVAAGDVWSRRFSDGLVVVNRAAAPRVVQLGGTYALPDGTSASVATVEGHGGLVLRSVDAPALRPSIRLAVERKLLRWRGARSTHVDLYRNGRLLGRIANDGAQRVKRLRASYRVCDAHTRFCSRAVRPRGR
jgi:hypothetical protein